MTRFVRNRIVLGVALSWLLYWPVVLIVPGQVLIEFISGMVAALSVGLVVAFFPGAWASLRRRPFKMSGGHLLILGVVVLQLAITGLFAWSWTYRILEKPTWMVDHAFRGWLVYLLFIGGVLHMMAGDVDHEALPTRGWMHVGAVITVGLGLTVALLLFI